MLDCLRNVFGFDVEQAKARPYSSSDEPRQGKRVAVHAFHETYLRVLSGSTVEKTGEDAQVEREYYAGVPKGFIAAEIDASRYPRELQYPIRRVFLAHAMPIKQLRQLWRDVAESRQEGA